MTTTTTQNSRGKTITLWVLRGLMAALFLFAAFAKFSGMPMLVAEFQKVGLGQWFRFFTATLELVGGITVLVPRFSALGAILLFLVDAGAFVAQITVLHEDWIHTIVIGAILLSLIYLQRDQLARK